MSGWIAPKPNAFDVARAAQIAAHLARAGRLEEALGVMRIALAQAPDYAQGQMFMARLLFRLRRWDEAWSVFGARFEARDGRALPAIVTQSALRAAPLLTKDSRARRVAVVAEGCVGDILTFARFLPGLSAAGFDAHFVVAARLIPLLRSLDPAPSFTPVENPGALDGFDAWMPMMDAPMILGLGEDQLRAPAPYLRAEPARVEAWRERLGRIAGPVYAIAWRSGPNDPSVATLDDFAPLAERPGARLICLQQDATEDQLAACAFRDRIFRPGPGFDADGAFLDSAALLAIADALVCNDAPLASLAGALGRPVHLLLAGEEGHWRWRCGEPENIWHASTSIWRDPSARPVELIARIAAT